MNKPTHEQAEIRDAGATLRTGQILKVNAFAGAGKTSTLRLIASARKDAGIYMAFNKTIADEAASSLAMTRCRAQTMHSIAYGAVRDVIGAPITLNASVFKQSGVRNRFTIQPLKGWDEHRIAAAVCRTMSAFANSDADDITAQHAVEALISTLGDPEMMRPGQKADQAREAIDNLAPVLAEMGSAFWFKLIEDGQMSHDMYLKMMDVDDNLRSKAFMRFRYLMVDEAQDLNPVQRSIIGKIGIPVIAVGDPYQAIYSWRGAENALAKMPGRTLYLTQSFRFGEDIAEVARHILQVRPDGGPSQRLTGVGGKVKNDYDGSKVAVVCRTNMGIVEEALKYMNKGRKIHVDNMPTLLQDVMSAQALHVGDMRSVKSATISQFNSWDELKLEADEGEGGLSKIVALIEGDRVGDIQSLARAQEKSQGSADVMIATAHRSKGMEWPGVILGDDWKDVDQMQGRYYKSLDQSAGHKTAAIEEYNALYVAATRPMTRLVGHERILFPEDIEDPIMKEDRERRDRAEGVAAPH